MKTVSATELAGEMAREDDVNVIDVREDDEVAKGMIPSALHIRLGDIAQSLDRLDKNKHYYIICRSGGRSAKACQQLQQAGFAVTNVQDGMNAWKGHTK